MSRPTKAREPNLPDYFTRDWELDAKLFAPNDREIYE